MGFFFVCHSLCQAEPRLLWGGTSQLLGLWLPFQPQRFPAEKHKQSLLHLGAKCRKEAGSASPILKPQHHRGPWYSPPPAQPPRPPLKSQIVPRRGCSLSHSEHLTEVSRIKQPYSVRKSHWVIVWIKSFSNLFIHQTSHVERCSFTFSFSKLPKKEEEEKENLESGL